MRNDWNDNNWPRTELQLQFVETTAKSSEQTAEYNLMHSIEQPASLTVDTKNSSSHQSARPQTSAPSQDWISAFNTSLLTTRAQNKGPSTPADLGALMQSPEFASILAGAQHLAASEGLSKEEATERLIEVFRSLDEAWKQIVIKRGIQAMIE